MGYKIAVFDASTLIGHEIITVLAETGFPADVLFALTTAQQSGRELSFGDIDVKTQDVRGFDFAACDILFHTGHGQDAKEAMNKAMKAGAKVIDVGGHFLLDETAPQECISIPSAIGTQLAAVLKPLHEAVGVVRAVVSTYEATSSEGKDGMDELFNQTRKFFVHDAMETQVFAKQIAFNVIPQTDHFMNDGLTHSEWRLAAEIKKLVDKSVKVTATCVQVPVFIGHGMSVVVECDKEIDAKTARRLWREQEGLTIIDTESEMEFVTPAEIAGEDAIFVSRIRNDATTDNGLAFWCAADNIRATSTAKAVEEARIFIAN